MIQDVSGANRTVHRFLWSSPGSFRKSLHPLSVNQETMPRQNMGSGKSMDLLLGRIGALT